MTKPYRFLALLLLLAFASSLATAAWNVGVQRRSAETPGLLPAAMANPVEVTTEHTLQAGETLSELLSRAELAQTAAQALLAELEVHHDPRRMRPGSVIALRRSLDDGEIRRMDLRLDADRTLSMLRDGGTWKGDIEEVPVRPDTVVLTGVVESSLYQALVDGDGAGVPSDERERVADILADRIFAWKVDFSRDLRVGDQFRILYIRQVRPDGTAREGRVASVQFTIAKRDYEAYAFAAGDDFEDYFDRSGASLRSAFLRAPLRYRRISSAFSRSRFHPILKVNRPHNGIDYSAVSGTPVQAVGDGVVRRANRSSDLGNVVEINHVRGYASRYAHLRGFADGIRPGVRVKQGDVIGYVGDTGLATAPHLHYEFHSGGRAINPSSVADIAGEPVPELYRAEFQDAMRIQIALLDLLSPRILLADGVSHPPSRSD
ncbi:MAG: peptidoglycan DD-metalloendopeptidase family protein [Gemmatimonadota bacterium]